MWRQMGVERTRAGLEDALAKLRFWARAVAELEPDEMRALELVNMLTVSRLSALGALAREESRGTHCRTDAPENRPEWRAHTVLRPVIESGRVARVDLAREPVPQVVPTA
jgi:aspartate oxidase